MSDFWYVQIPFLSPIMDPNLVGNSKTNLLFEEVLEIGWNENSKGGLETRFING